MLISFVLALLVAPPPDLPPLVARPPWKPDATLPRHDFDWERVLENRDIRLLADNQFTLYFESKPGIARVQYYPRRRPVRLVGKLDYSVLSRETQYRAEGVGIQFVDGAGKSVHVCRRATIAGGRTRWNGSGAAPIGRFSKRSRCSATSPVCGSPNCAGRPCMSRSPTPRHRSIWFGCVSHPAPVSRSMRRSRSCSPSATNPRRSPPSWPRIKPIRPRCLQRPAACGTTTSRAMVPRLEAADERLVRLYYYQFYVVRSSLYDIPYEPYVYPYTCPWKTGAIWQWSWNTPDERGGRALAQRFVHLESRHAAHRRQPGRALLRHASATSQTGLQESRSSGLVSGDGPAAEARGGTGSGSGLVVRDALHGAEFVSRNLGSVLDDRRPRSFCAPTCRTWRVTRNPPESAPRPGTLLTPFQIMVDEYDYSLRWKPVQSGFTKGGLQRGFDVPVLNGGLQRLPGRVAPHSLARRIASWARARKRATWIATPSRAPPT